MEDSKMDGKALIDMDIIKLKSRGFTSKAKGLVLLRKVSEWLSEYPLTSDSDEVINRYVESVFPFSKAV